MADNELDGKTDVFLQELEKSILKILKATKVTKSERIAAITAGTRLALIKHRINGGDDSKGFFDK
jgi:hypothetical protein